MTLVSWINLSRQAFDESGENNVDLWKAKQIETSADAGKKYIDLKIQQFSKDNFTVKNLDRVFSNMGFDQAHEQNNKIVKAGGGRIVFLITKLLWSIGQSVDLRFLTYFRKYSATTKKMT